MWTRNGLLSVINACDKQKSILKSDPVSKTILKRLYLKDPYNNLLYKCYDNANLESIGFICTSNIFIDPIFIGSY